ncbi:response regulator [Solicola gregarius]|uniref:Transcriptional regulatory protein n=1 Tax=Solicola gregarius TaxID=2908642 RepID=A0AA46TLX6_9ACTN|nr:response regulator [Solicola gregarius]UYM07732.1 response regulator [Solicola gregarius]
MVEDEPTTAAAHGEYVGRVAGFELAGTAYTGQEALRALSNGGIDVVLLDMNLPDRHGLDVVRAMRAAGDGTDVIAVTSARELTVVRQAASLGIAQYLLKPFVFTALRERLESWANHRRTVEGQEVVTNQQSVDRLLSRPRATTNNTLPKGLSPESLDAVTGLLQEADALSAAEVADRMSSSRVTARRYLEYLHDIGLAVRRPRYAATGRPVIEYVWRALT